MYTKEDGKSFYKPDSENDDRSRSEYARKLKLLPLHINSKARLSWTNGRLLASNAKSISLNANLREENSNIKLKRILQNNSQLSKLQLTDHDLGCRQQCSSDKLLTLPKRLRELDLECFDVHNNENNLYKMIYKLKYNSSRIQSFHFAINTEMLSMSSVKMLARRIRQMVNLKKLSLSLITSDLTQKKFRIILAAVTSLSELRIFYLKVKNLSTIAATAITMNLSRELYKLKMLNILSLSFRCCHCWSETPFMLLTTAVAVHLRDIKRFELDLVSVNFEMVAQESFLTPLKQLPQLKALKLSLYNVKTFGSKEMKQIALILESQAYLSELTLELVQLPVLSGSSWNSLISSLESLAHPQVVNLNLDLVPKGRVKSQVDLNVDMLTKIMIKQDWSSLKSLQLHYRNDFDTNSQLIKDVVFVLQFLPYLKHLSLNFQLPDVYNDESLIALSRAIDGLDYLQEFEFTLPKSRSISQEGLARMAIAIGKKIKLKALHLNLTNPNKSCQNDKFFDALGDSLVGLPNLRNLSLLLTRISINDESCLRFSKALSKLNNLESFLWSLTYGGHSEVSK